jgi:hypothetical protein
MQARRLPARHGALWLVAGFRLLRANPPLLTALTLGYLSCVIVINIVPVLGPLLLPILLPMLTVVVANGCRAAEHGRAVTPAVLGVGVRSQRIPLIRLGGLHLLGSLAVLAISVGIEGGDLLGALPQPSLDDQEVLALFLRLMLIALPVLMAFWFAPLLTGWDNVPALKSLFFSAIASYRNWRAFAAYGLTVVIVGVAIPGGILILAGLIDESLTTVLSVVLRMALVFMLAPALTASLYISYRDVFAPEAGASREPDALDQSGDTEA